MIKDSIVSTLPKPLILCLVFSAGLLISSITFNYSTMGKGGKSCKWCAQGECWSHGAGKGGGKSNQLAQLFGMSMGGGGGDGKKVSKTIGWMNKTLALAEPIAYKEVSPMLNMMNEHDATVLLHELSEQHETIKNPTRRLIAAANRRM